MAAAERAISLTHEHLLAALVAEAPAAPGRVVRILDLGCGEGELLAYLERNLPRLRPDLQFVLYGLDVSDHGMQRGGFLERCAERLGAGAADSSWRERLFGVRSGAPWPLPDAQLDFIVSNQVLEHVRDPAPVFSEMARALADDGRAVHLFPLRHIVREEHLFLPWVHRIGNADLRLAYIRALSRLGLGKYRGHRRTFGMTLDEYSGMHADYIAFMTHYLSEDEVLRHAARAGLRASFRYTQEFYFRKLRQLLGRPASFSYSPRRNGLADWLWMRALRYVSGVTLFLEKRQTYAVPHAAAHAAPAAGDAAAGRAGDSAAPTAGRVPWPPAPPPGAAG